MVKPTLSGLALCLVCIACSVNSSYAGVIYKKAFQGVEQESGVMLSWSTSIEENSSLFIIEKAEDGEAFESVGAIGGAGDSEELTDYNFLDFNNRGTYVLYRLKQLDKDGTVTYSKTLFINKINDKSFTVSKMSEVIASDNFEVTFDLMINTNVVYHLKNAKGETVLKEDSAFQKGINYIIINMEDAEVGMYKLLLSVGGEEEEIAFEKVTSTKQKNKAVVARKE